MTKDEEIKRQNEKIAFLARTNMLYSDWEHRNNQVTSDLIHKGIEEAKINAKLRAEIELLKAQLAQPTQELDACCAECGKKKSDGWFLYCVECVDDKPAQKPWVGPTDEEIIKIINSNNSTGLWQIAIQIESALRSKNT
jgi:hypothetical protein